MEYSSTENNTMKKRTSIAFFISSFHAGGAETQFWNLVKSIDRSKYRVYVVQLSYKNRISTKDESLDAGDSEVVTFYRKNKFDFISVLKVASYIRKNKIDIIQSMLFMDNQYARLAGLLSRARVVTSIRGEIAPMLGKFKTRVELSTQFLSRKIVVNSQWLKQYMIKLGTKESKLVVVYNGVDLIRFKKDHDVEQLKKQLKIPSNKIIIGIAARLHPMKDHITFFNFLKKLLTKNQNIVALVVGGGALEDELKAHCEKIGIKNNTKFTGEINNIQLYYKLMDILVLTSSWGESFPNVLLEAMASGTPVVATNVSAVPEIINEGFNGYMVDVGNYTQICDKVNGLIGNKDDYIAIANNGKNFVEKFNIDQMRLNFEKLYSTLV